MGLSPLLTGHGLVMCTNTKGPSQLKEPKAQEKILGLTNILSTPLLLSGKVLWKGHVASPNWRSQMSSAYKYSIP